MYKNNWKSFKPETNIKLSNTFRFNPFNNNQKNTHIQNQYYNYPNSTIVFNNMNRPSPNINSMPNNNLINNINSSNTTNIMDNSIKNIDFFLLDSYENIKNIKFIKDMSLNDTIYLIFVFNGRIKSYKYKINDLYSRYFFVKINNPEKQAFIGLLLPKNEINENTDIKKYVIYKINNSKIFNRDFEVSLKMKFNDNYYFDLIENKNFTSNLFKYAFNILLDSIKDNNINQKNNIINNNNNINISSQKNFNNNQIYNNLNINNNIRLNNNNNQNNFMLNIKYYFPLKGLCNIDSTYYMNSIIQCLLHSNELFAYYLN